MPKHPQNEDRENAGADEKGDQPARRVDRPQQAERLSFERRQLAFNSRSSSSKVIGAPSRKRLPTQSAKHAGYADSPSPKGQKDEKSSEENRTPSKRQSVGAIAGSCARRRRRSSGLLQPITARPQNRIGDAFEICDRIDAGIVANSNREKAFCLPHSKEVKR